MSIFKDTFIPEIQRQLKARQTAISQRTLFQGNSTTIQYLNSRNAWIKMSSSVNIVTPGGDPNGTSDLAKSYVLQGGILTPDGKTRIGVGTGTNQAYSNQSPSGQTYQRGLRPMPGINSIDIKSKSAYGSLREITVNFQCWDIKQLEDLELLYMRPNYSVLIEWGWLPYLKADDNGNPVNIETNIQYYDKLFKDSPSKEAIWKELFEKSQTYQGNYDAMFGFVKNYSWSARPDGGYDCTTSIISIGEVLESLKVNYTPLNLKFGGNQGIGLAFKNVSPAVLDRYKKNILAGLFAEFYEKVKDNNRQVNEDGNTLVLQNYEFFIKKLATENSSITEDANKMIGAESDNIQVYIKLKSLVNLLNKYVILSDTKTKTPLVKLSINERVYDKPKGKNNAEPPLNELLCLANPLQVSVDPTICLIGNDLWSNIKKSEDSTAQQPTSQDITGVSNKYAAEIKKIIDAVEGGNKDENEQIVISTIKSVATGPNAIKNLEELNKEFQINNPRITNPSQDNTTTTANVDGVEVTVSTPSPSGKTLYSYINEILTNRAPFYGSDGFQIDQAINVRDSQDNILPIFSSERDKRINAISKDEWKEVIDLKVKKSQTKLKNAKIVQSAIKGSQYLKNLDSFFFDNTKELGKIGNIYINLQFLYGLSLDNNLESQDKKEKQEIALYDFIKNIMSQVSNVIGNVNNFDIHVDPIDNVARIIDINYADSNPKETTFKNIFELELHSLKSTVRSYKLESQIFPEQSTTVAIGAQVQGGALGTDSNTMAGFNRNIIDRIIPTKDDPNSIQADINKKREQDLLNLQENLKTIYKFFGNTSTENIFWTKAAYDVNGSGQYTGALRDLIKGFQSLTKDKNKYNAIIPTKLSFEMDGIGGLVIGHLFKIPDNLLPKGYKGSPDIVNNPNAGLGSKLGYIITGIGHKIQSNDWTTNIEAQTIILDNPTTGVDVDYEVLLNLASQALAEDRTLNPEDIETARNNALRYSDTTYQKAATYAKRMMKDLNLTDAQAAGIFGNLIYESGGTLRPDVIENKKGYTVEDIPIGTDSVGVGWAQWTNSRGVKDGEGRMDKFLFPNRKRKPKSELTDDYNYNYLINEIKRDYKEELNSIKNVSTVRAASDIFLLEFERPKDQGAAQQQRREEIGNVVLEYIRNNSYVPPSLKYPPSPSSPPPIISSGGFRLTSGGFRL